MEPNVVDTNGEIDAATKPYSFTDFSPEPGAICFFNSQGERINEWSLSKTERLLNRLRRELMCYQLPLMAR